MGYSKDVYQQAYEILDSRRAKAQRIQQQHKQELYSKVPQLLELEQSLAATGAAAAAAAVGGGDDALKQIQLLKQANQQLQQHRYHILASLGLPTDYLDLKYICPHCQDTGYIGQRVCSCLQKLLRQVAYEKMCSISDVDQCRFENFSLNYYPMEPVGEYQIVPRNAMRDVVHYCAAYADTFSQNSESLLLCGGTGLGKTHLSLAMAYEITQKEYGVVYTTSQKLMDQLQAQQFSRGETTDYQSLALECDLLIIDDLGAEFSTSFTVAALYNIINTRISEKKPTIINTNLDTSVMKERYGDRILSRLLCAYRPLKFYGRDIRMLKRYQK